MSEPRVHAVAPKARRRVRRRVAALTILTALVATVCLYRYYVNPERIRGLAERFLQDLFQGEVTVGAAQFSWLSGVRLEDVTVLPAAVGPFRPDAQPSAYAPNPVFTCAEVRITYALASLLRGRLDARSIVAYRPTCWIVRDRETGRTNLAGLFQTPPPNAGFDPSHGPTVELRDARIQVGSRDQDSTRITEDLRLTVRARPVGNDGKLYDIVWNETAGRHASGYSQIDLDAAQIRNIRGGMPWMAIDAVMLALNARYDGSGAWCDLLGLDGTVRARDYNLSADEDGNGPRTATIDLDDASISIPIDARERPLGPDERYLRFDKVNGTVRLSDERIEADFEGMFHGASCRVSVTFFGEMASLTTLEDAGFEARLAITGLRVPRPDSTSPPEQIRFIRRWHRLDGFYEDYDPDGTVDLDVELFKHAGPGQNVIVRQAEMIARGGTASCRFFPYRGDDVRGTVELNEDGVFIRDIRGTHDGAEITVNGWLAAPTRAARKEVRIDGANVPIDDALIEPLPQRYRTIVDEFAPTGRVNVHVELTQEQGADRSQGRWTSHTDIELRDVSATYRAFPYPADHLVGTIRVDRERLELSGVRGSAGEATITVDGAVAFDTSAVGDSREKQDRTGSHGPRPSSSDRKESKHSAKSGGSVREVQLNVRAKDATFDEHLFAALPVSARDLLMSLSPTGRFDVDTNVTLDVDGRKPVYSSDVSLRGVSILPARFPLKVTDLAGDLRLTPDSITFDRLEGRHDGATLMAERGVIRPAEPFAELSVQARGLRLGESLRAALPVSLSNRIRDWSVDGAFSVDTDVAADSASGPRATRCFVTFDGANVRYAGFPVPFQEVQGNLSVTDKGVLAKGLRARFASGDLDVGFEIQDDAGKIRVRAKGVSVPEALPALLGDAWSERWERIRPGGTIDVNLDSLRFRRAEGSTSRVWTVDGYAELNDLALHGIANLKEMVGSVTVRGALVDRAGGASLSGSLTLPQASLLKQPLTSTECSWTFQRAKSGEGRLSLDAIRGRAHDGSMTGRVELTFDKEHTNYNIGTTVYNAQIAGMLDEAAPQARQDRQAATNNHPRTSDMRGLLDGQIYLAGSVDDTSSRRGGGRFEVRQGHIYKTPLVLAILNVLNLSLPDEDVFDDARGSFFIVGDRVQFAEIQLHGQALSLIGSGSMSLPDRTLDLNLVHVSPHRWARVPVLAEFVESATRELVELHVTGSLEKPIVRAQPLRGISEEFQELFQRRKPRLTSGSPPR